MAYRISKSIPIPQDLQTRPQRCPWPAMKVGHSISFDDGEEYKKALKAARAWGKGHKAEFAGKYYRNKYRIWRVA